MDLPGYFMQLYEYHYWANRRALSAAAKLTQDQLHKPQGHSWGSVLGVLLHMMSAEWMWMQRCNGVSPNDFPPPENFPTLQSIQQEWSKLEASMMPFIAAQTPETIQAEVHYSTRRGQPYTLQVWQILAHVANHGTHHRGELAAMFAVLETLHSEDDWNRFFLEKSGQIEIS